jgi:hypothetical protein
MSGEEMEYLKSGQPAAGGGLPHGGGEPEKLRTVEQEQAVLGDGPQPMCMEREPSIRGDGTQPMSMEQEPSIREERLQLVHVEQEQAIRGDGPQRDSAELGQLTKGGASQMAAGELEVAGWSNRLGIEIAEPGRTNSAERLQREMEGMERQGWKLLYENPLAAPGDTAGFWMEGSGAATFPMGRLRLESTRDPAEGQRANLVYWCPDEFPPDIAVAWDFQPIREPGLAIMFLAARGKGDLDLFNPELAPRTGGYDEYHHGDINAFHISYFRRRWPEERSFHTCNLRKSYGFHLVAQGADPLPGVADAVDSYRMVAVKRGPRIQFFICGLPVFEWVDDGVTYGPLLGGGKVGFRQMAPFIAEYANLRVYGL